jgi:hypothetical protein
VTDLRSSQVCRLVLYAGTPNTRVTQFNRLVLYAGKPTVRAAQLNRMVLFTTTALSSKRHQLFMWGMI